MNSSVFTLLFIQYPGGKSFGGMNQSQNTNTRQAQLWRQVISIENS